MFPEAISPSLAAILRDINNWQLPLGTYMAGGTAVAAYLGHRESLDIDFYLLY